VGHALRADADAPIEDVVNEDAAVGRRRERVARMMARLPRRGPGAPEPTTGGAGHGRVVIA